MAIFCPLWGGPPQGAQNCSKSSLRGYFSECSRRPANFENFVVNGGGPTWRGLLAPVCDFHWFFQCFLLQKLKTVLFLHVFHKKTQDGRIFSGKHQEKEMFSPSGAENIVNYEVWTPWASQSTVNYEARAAWDAQSTVNYEPRAALDVPITERWKLGGPQMHRLKKKSGSRKCTD